MWYLLTVRDKWSSRILACETGTYAALCGMVVDFCFKRPGGFTWTLIKR